MQRLLGDKKEVVRYYKIKRKLKSVEKSCLFYYFLALKACKEVAVDEFSKRYLAVANTNKEHTN